MEQEEGLRVALTGVTLQASSPMDLTAALEGRSYCSHFTEEQPKAREAESHA